MTRDPSDSHPVVYRIDGRKTKSPSDFYREIGSAVNGAGGYFGRNLDSLADCLRGGFGTPDTQAYEFVWQHSSQSRRHLSDLTRGRQTLFDAIVDVFSDAGVRLRLN